MFELGKVHQQTHTIKLKRWCSSLSTTTMTDIVERSGFPPGYFVVRSAACERLLDVSGDEIEDGTEIVLWPEKEKSLVESEYEYERKRALDSYLVSGSLPRFWC
jgi:hypothetical protein